MHPILHADNGGSMKGATLQATMQHLGILASHSRRALSNDNPFSEAWFKTLKYAPRYPWYFATPADARTYVERFVEWYNHDHLHSGVGFVTPAQRHAGEDRAILEQRKAVYEEAKATHPERWNGRPIRNWDRVGVVILNPEKGKTENPAWADAA